MLAGNIATESRAHFNNGLPFEPHQNHIHVFNQLCVAKLALQDGIVCLYIKKSVLFMTYIKVALFFFSKNWGVLMTTFLAMWHSAMLRLCVITKIQSTSSMILCQSHRHLSGHCVPYHTGFSFQIHFKVTDPYLFHCSEFWISCGLNEDIYQHILTTEQTFEPHQKQPSVWHCSSKVNW